MANTLTTFKERPELRSQIGGITSAAWPRFMLESAPADRAWPYLFEAFADFQLALCDEEGRLVAFGNSIPLVWDGQVESLPEGWDAATLQAVDHYEAGRIPNALSAFQIVVDPQHQGKGYSSMLLNALRSAAQEHGFHSLIACVRPTLKALYPLTPIERYAQWKQPDGSPFDPWVRVHWRAGAEQLHASPRSMEITGTVAQWQEWTGLRFPESGPYIVAGALQPIVADLESDLVRYEDSNIWMWHKTIG